MRVQHELETKELRMKLEVFDENSEDQASCLAMQMQELCSHFGN